MGTTKPPIFSYLPDEVYGWTIDGDDNIYDEETIFDYINGAAELYFSYGFEEVITRRFTKENQPDIVVEIYDLLKPANAFGVFTYSREKDDGKFGQGSQYLPGSLIFWKDRYYVSIISYDETAEVKDAMLHFASEIDKAIEPVGKKPEVMEYLPQNKLVDDGFIYFHHYIWLNSYFYISGENILNIHNKVQAVMARYKEEPGTYFRLVVMYPDRGEARKAFQAFRENLNIPKDSKIAELNENQWLACTLEGNVFFAVFNASTSENAMKFLNEFGSNDDDKR